MAVRVLVVDDSGFFRRRVTEMLEADSDITVIGAAENGKVAVEKVKELKPDVVTMDIEMPEMDGITATRQIMESTPTRIIMFSSLTTDGAKSTLDALDAGALDFLQKRFEEISSDREEAKQLLCERVKELVKQPINLHAPAPRKPVAPSPSASTTTSTLHTRPASPVAAAPTRGKHGGIDLVAIGTSTGGPVALQEVLTKLPKGFPVPIILVQHMPGSFTPAFAQRLNDLCDITVKEAEDGEAIKNSCAYLAPGGKQMLVEGRAGHAVIKIIEAEPSQTYKPSVDITFSSIAKLYPNNTLAVILTGMGADGREGSRALKAGGSTVWAQDESSCVVYGMPSAVTEAGITDRELTLVDVGPNIAQRV